jgi:hypothetical protein
MESLTTSTAKWQEPPVLAIAEDGSAVVVIATVRILACRKKDKQWQL